MDKRIYGTLICQNAIPDIVRCIESVSPHVDEFLIMDGGSTDGTWEWLNKYKDVYHLTLFQHPYDEQGNQRNRLLAKVPKNTWCINIDQDEKLCCSGFKEYLDRISPELLMGKDRDLPLTLRIPCINLVDDILHYNDNTVMLMATKIFYNDRNVHFTNGYHMTVCYFDTENNTNAVPVPKEWVIKHYAYLDNERLAKSAKDTKRCYEPEEWDRNNWKVIDLPDKWL
jgi:glycosyltransferase involved in cell wall biosynthesis